MSHIEIFFKIIELVFSFMGLVFVVFGWIIPYRQDLKEEKKRRKFEIELLKCQWEKEFVDRQISNLYGPIAALLRQNEIIYSLIMYQLGRSYVFGRNQWKLSDLAEEDQKVWAHYVDNYLLPTMGKIVDIINENQHLIYNSRIPKCFEVFLDYALGWELLDNQKRSGVPNYYDYYYSFNFPILFNEYINITLKKLLNIQKELTYKAA